MLGFKTENGFLDFSNTDFQCPSCKHEHIEDDYIKKLEKKPTLPCLH